MVRNKIKISFASKGGYLLTKLIIRGVFNLGKYYLQTINRCFFLKYFVILIFIFVCLEFLFDAPVLKPRMIGELEVAKGIYYFNHAKGKIQSSFIVLADENGKAVNIYLGPCQGAVSDWTQFNGRKANILYYHERHYGMFAYQIEIADRLIYSLGEANHYLEATADDRSNQLLAVRICSYLILLLLVTGWGYVDYIKRLKEKE